MSSILILWPRALGLLHHAGGDVEGLDEILEVRALAADVEAEALDHQSQIEGGLNQVTASPGSAPNLEDSSTTEPVLGTRRRSTTPA